jgi:hypothetical protein
MADEDQQEPGKEVKPQYQVVSTDENALSDEDLYSFRQFHQGASAEQPATPATKPKKAPKSPSKPAKTDSSSPSDKKTPMFAMVAAILIPVLIVAVVLVMLLQRQQSSTYDLGTGYFNAVGLKGHLITTLKDKASYRILVEPINERQVPAFSAAVSNPPRPLSVTFQLVDSSGHELCTKTLDVKIDPTAASIYTGSDSMPSPKQEDATSSAGNSPGQQTNLAAQDSREFERKRGQDIFQGEIAADGQIAAIYAQGEFPCSAALYKRVSSWVLTADIPGISPVGSSANDQPEASDDSKAPVSNNSSGKKTGIATLKSLPSPIEGDTTVTGDNLKLGLVETSSGRTFVVDKHELLNSGSKWLVFPASIHYRCDKKALCLLTRSGSATVQYARLKK